MWPAAKSSAHNAVRRGPNVSAATSLSWLTLSCRRRRSMNRVPLEKNILSENDLLAAELRERFREHGTLCLNLISAPGLGKTSLLEKTLESLPHSERVAVLTGDIQTENDATRLRRCGFPVKQITTGGTCHLDARMTERHLADWRLEEIDLLFIENVGN